MLGTREPDISNTSYSKLLRGFIVGAVACSVFPLFLLGWISFLNYSDFSTSRMSEYFKNAAIDNRKIVELFLEDRVSNIKLIAATNSFDYLKESSNINDMFRILNQRVSHFTDLAVIDSDGKQVAYAGQFNLSGAYYNETAWFREVMEKGVCISKVALGFQKTPHFSIAVRQSDDGTSFWVLRATIETQSLESLIDMTKSGETGEVFVVNREGVYQTSPRVNGAIMEKSSLPIDLFRGDSGVMILDVENPLRSVSIEESIPLYYRLSITFSAPHSRQILAYSLLKNPDWFVVAKQDFLEFFGDIDHLNLVILALLHMSILAIVIVSSLTARYMTKLIERRDKEAEKLNRQLSQARKLASVGELAAGVAHEINNPLAVIMTETMVMRELTADEKDIRQQFRDDLFNSLSQIDGQIQRCAHITQNLLNFSRRISSASEFVDINSVLKDVTGFVDRKALSCGVKVSLNLEQNLPELKTDRFELEQVFLNLINNAIDANEGGSEGSVNIVSRLDPVRKGVIVSVADTGTGISDDNLDRLFDPFFTTKPPGRGTGLGLSISYSIVKHLGGEITVQSELGRGAVFSIFLPYLSDEQKSALYMGENTTKENQDEKTQAVNS